MNQRAIRVLEFNKILQTLSSFASSSSARGKIMEIRPYLDKAYIERLLVETEEADKVLFVHSMSPSFNFDDIAFPLEKASVMSVLTMGEIIKIGRVLRVARNLRSLIEKINDESIVLLRETVKGIFIDKGLEDEIDRCILSESEMSDNASAELRNIRQKIKRISENIKNKLTTFVTSSTYSKYLQDNIITVRGDRYVIPVKSECKGSIPGLVHDQSSSGATLYVEPMVIVELNNDLKTCYIEESREIERILRDFTLKISISCESIKASFDIITDLDVVFAKAYYANKYNCVRPVITSECYIDIVKGRHPLIDGKKVVSNSISVGKNAKMLFITGPNTGGKTVCLKLVGLLSLMALSGLFIPVREAEIGMFDNIFCDIGDEQSIEQNLSTFSSHISNIKNILDEFTDRSLLLFDELGAGTDPTEGAALALAISEHIRNKGAKAIITTHYNELKEYAVVKEDVENASMEFNPNTYSPTFKLTMGTPGASNALLIAERLGINNEIIESARNGIKGHKVEFENVLMQLEKARRDAEDALDEAEKLRHDAKRINIEAEREREKLFLQREKLNQSVKKETKRLVETAVTEANEIIDTLKNMLDAPTEADVFKAHKLRKQLKKYLINEENEFQEVSEELGGEIRVGDAVLVKSINSEGTVESVNPIKGEAFVKLGGISSKIKLDNLQRLKSKKVIKKDAKPSIRELKNEIIVSEINIIGKTSDEVGFSLDAFIDQAVFGGLSELRIIHGLGEGILRKTVRAYLAKHRSVKDYRDGKYGEGGKGVTVVTLK